MNIEIIENESGFFYNQLSFAGVTDADHRGCLCLPEYEAEIVASFAQYLQQQSWSILELSNIVKENKRFSLLLSNFEGASFEMAQQSTDSYRNPLDRVRNDNKLSMLGLAIAWVNN